MERLPLPVYKTPGGAIRPIAGVAAQNWPSPRFFEADDGALFVEWPMPYECDWGLTFHTGWRRTIVGQWMAQYVEGRCSGFPFWATFYYATRVVFLHDILRRKAEC